MNRRSYGNPDGMEPMMEPELKCMRFLMSLYPLPKGRDRLCNIMNAIYTRKRRGKVVSEVLGYKMLLDPYECVDKGLLYAPEHYDRKELRLLADHLGHGDTFLDLGANIGFYSLMASGMVGSTGKVISVEADRDNFSLLQRNIELNGIRNIRPVNCGVADQPGTLRLGRNLIGNRGGHSFLSDSDDAVDVECLPLLEILRQQGIESVSAAKLDIEGMEYRVLAAFIRNAPASLYPQLVIMEDNVSWHAKMGGDPVALLQEAGYQLLHRFGNNAILRLK
jgi:FkbM family methyltransferase